MNVKGKMSLLLILLLSFLILYTTNCRFMGLEDLKIKVKWRFKTGHCVYSSPAIGEDGTIYVGADDYYLYAINPDGSLKWKFKTGWGSRSSPAIGEDGTIYVGADDYYLYAISTVCGGPADTPWPMFHHDPHHTGRYGYEEWK